MIIEFTRRFYVAFWKSYEGLKFHKHLSIRLLCEYLWAVPPYGSFEGVVRGAVIRIPPLYREWPNPLSKGRYGGIKGITRGGARPNALLGLRRPSRRRKF
jgi:hypothetical protein